MITSPLSLDATIVGDKINASKNKQIIMISNKKKICLNKIIANQIGGIQPSATHKIPIYVAKEDENLISYEGNVAFFPKKTVKTKAKRELKSKNCYWQLGALIKIESGKITGYFVPPNKLSVVESNEKKIQEQVDTVVSILPRRNSCITALDVKKVLATMENIPSSKVTLDGMTIRGKIIPWDRSLSQLAINYIANM